MAVMQGANLAGANPTVAQISTSPSAAPAETADAYGRYTAAVLRGNCYMVSDTAGNTLAAGLTTAATCVSLANPLGSGVNLVLIYASLAVIVVNAAANVIWVGINPTNTANVTTGTALAVQNCNGGGGTGKVKGLTGLTLRATPTIFGDLGVGLTGAITTVPQTSTFYRWWDGLLQVGPGGTLSMQASAATASTSSFAAWIWEEVPTTVASI